MASQMQQPFLNQNCTHCGFGNYIETFETGDWWLSCNECNALLFCYVPMDHQYEFHQDPHKYKAFFGGYGSAKTSTCAAEMIKLTLSTPNGTSLVGAATLPQLEQTAKKDLMSMLHPSLIDNYSIQKNYIDLVNGHRILFRPLDTEGKARSLNLCYVWIEEGSEVAFDYVVQLQTRLRNHATKRHQMIISSNPDLGWVRNEFLLKADQIHGSERNYFVPEEDKNENISVHIASTRKNKYLPIDYYHSVAKGKETWWIERYLNASFEYAEGAVYSTFSDHIVKPFEIPQHWERLGGADFGIRDHTVLLMGAIDPDTGIVYIYKEYFKNQLPIPVHAKKMKEMVQEVPYGKLRVLVGDPAGKRGNIADMRTLFDHYAEYGLWFKEGTNRIDAGIAKVSAYFSLGRLKIFNTCVNTIREGLNYKYKPMELDSKKNMDEKPIDKDNHTMDSLRYMIQELPDDPSQLIQKSYQSRDWGGKMEDGHIPFALQSEEKPTKGRDLWLYY
jgi:PBSX family phage terminase large subunit